MCHFLFNPGDVVRTKGSGPLMTVEEYDSDNKVVCIWFSSNDLRRSSFVEESLELSLTPSH